MNARKSVFLVGSLMMLMLPLQRAYGQPKPEVVKFEPFTWRSEPPSDYPAVDRDPAAEAQSQSSITKHGFTTGVSAEPCSVHEIGRPVAART
jgi:hypothetical protein